MAKKTIASPEALPHLNALIAHFSLALLSEEDRIAFLVERTTWTEEVIREALGKTV
jgi:hypothetical protein